MTELAWPIVAVIAIAFCAWLSRQILKRFDAQRIESETVAEIQSQLDELKKHVQSSSLERLGRTRG